MFNIGLPEMLIILAIALIVFGPNKLPELARAFGRAIREFRKATEEVKESFREETRDLEELKSSITQEDLLSDFAEALQEEKPAESAESQEPPEPPPQGETLSSSPEKITQADTASLPSSPEPRLPAQGELAFTQEEPPNEGPKEESKEAQKGISSHG